MKNKKVIFQDWGLIDYKEAWDRQEALFAETVDLKTRIRNRKITSEGDEYEEDEPTPNYLVFCEHPHVYTLGQKRQAGAFAFGRKGPERKKCLLLPH